MRTTYRGIPALKCPFDYVLYQMIIYEVNPDLVIEIGTNDGGSTLYIADLLRNLGKGMVHSIDISNKPLNDNLHQYTNIKLFTNGWENYDLAEVNQVQKIIVIEDSAHTYENTLQVLRKFAPIVSKNSYFIVEDGIVDELNMAKDYNGGPLAAIKTFLNENEHFVIDRKWCDFYGTNATFNVNGYLRKVMMECQ
jgi:cephalosporin hydroxylase